MKYIHFITEAILGRLLWQYLQNARFHIFSAHLKVAYEGTEQGQDTTQSELITAILTFLPN